MTVGRKYAAYGPNINDMTFYRAMEAFDDKSNNNPTKLNEDFRFYLNPPLNEDFRFYLNPPSVNQSTPVVQSAPQQAMPVVDQEMSPSTMSPSRISPSGMSYLQRALALTEQQPDTAALQEYARARQAQGQQSMLNALAAGIAGPQYQGLQQGYLRRAMAAQEPEQVGSGMAYGGKYITDPYASRKEQISTLSDIGKAIIEEEQDSKTKYQQGGPFAFLDGTIVSAMFDPNTGSYVYDTGNGLATLPAGSRPTTAGVAAPLSAKQFNTLTSELNNEQNSLTKINNYLSSVENTDVGLTRLANDISANAKTLFGSKKLSNKELTQQVAKGQLQGLLGMLRLDVVGPGVMTEQDAQRVIQAVGGDFNLLQNPETVKELLKEIIEQKQKRINLLNRQVQFSERFYPGIYDSYLSNSDYSSSDYGAPPADAVRLKSK